MRRPTAKHPPKAPRASASGRPPKPDPAALKKAVEDFLDAAGLDRRHPHFKDTPSRVTQAWVTEFLDGYQRTPEEALGEVYLAPEASAGEMVIVTDLRFHSMCPHHLLPVEGRAHLAYLPAKHVVGFGRLSKLLDCFAHRLILQEELARAVAQSLARVLKSPGAACIVEARQSCLRVRGDQQCDAWAHAEAYEGRLRRDKDLRRELWARLPSRSSEKRA